MAFLFYYLIRYCLNLAISLLILIENCKLCTRTRSLSRVILYKQCAQGLRGPGQIGCETFLVVGFLVLEEFCFEDD
jgi:hypothetical protein